MSKAHRTKRNNAPSKSGDNMAEVATEVKTVHESKKVKPITADGVKTETQQVDATFGKVEGSISYPRATALTVAGALEMAKAQNLTKTEKVTVDGKETEKEVPLTDEEKFLKYFNAGYDATMRLTARNELAVIVEGPEKQINAIASRIAKSKYGDDSDENIAKVKALPEFTALVAVMS